MNAFTLLKADHRKVAEIFKALAETTERAIKAREELFTKLKTELDVHSKIEESIFYPALEKAEETREIILEALEEHALVKQLLKELQSSAKDEEQWTAKLTVLKENVEHHIEEEEGEMFTRARKVLSDSDIQVLGTRLEKAKEEQEKTAADR